MGKQVVIVKKQNGRPKAFGGIQAACDYFGWNKTEVYQISKSALKAEEPYEYKGHTIERLSVKRAKTEY